MKRTTTTLASALALFLLRSRTCFTHTHNEDLVSR
jgi:hypothetical protein